jgi:hypothetical protein
VLIHKPCWTNALKFVPPIRALKFPKGVSFNDGTSVNTLFRQDICVHHDKDKTALNLPDTDTFNITYFFDSMNH